MVEGLASHQEQDQRTGRREEPATGVGRHGSGERVEGRKDEQQVDAAIGDALAREKATDHEQVADGEKYALNLG